MATWMTINGPEGPAQPIIGAHGLTGHIDGSGSSPITVTIDTQASGSSLLACGGFGVISNMATPTDNKSNTFTQRGSTTNYTAWPGSGIKLFADDSIAGGSSHTVSAVKNASVTQEATLAVVEVKNGGVIGTPSIVEPTSGATGTSGSVTTTGAAVLVCWHWGDAGVAGSRTCRPQGGSGFATLDSYELTDTAHVQCVVAYREVSSAGTYSVTWDQSPSQRALIVLVAVQKA